MFFLDYIFCVHIITADALSILVCLCITPFNVHINDVVTFNTPAFIYVSSNAELGQPIISVLPVITNRAVVRSPDDMLFFRVIEKCFIELQCQTCKILSFPR